MKLKSSNKYTYIFLGVLCLMTVVLLSLKRTTKKASKYVSAPDIEQKTTLNFIQLSLREKHYKKLKKKRDKALSIGILETNDSDYVPATVTYNGKEYRADIRLKGDWTDHLIGDKWSFRVKLKDDQTILGMRKFSIHHPKTRGNINEWLYHKAIKKEDLFGLRYDFVEGFIHIKKDNAFGYINKDVGIYAIEETFDKRTIENNKRKESVILKFSEDIWWKEVKKALEVGSPYGMNWNKFMNNKLEFLNLFTITAFSEEKVMLDSTMHNYFKLSKNLLVDLREGNSTLDQVFDIKELAKQNAILNLFGAVHNNYSINLRFYYNPITSKLEPIAFDGNSGAKLQKYAHFLFVNQEKDSIYLKELALALNEVSRPEYLSQLVANNESDLLYYQKVLKKEFKPKLFHLENLKYNQNILRRELLRLKEMYDLEHINTEVLEGSENQNYEFTDILKWQNKGLLLQKNNDKSFTVSRKNIINSSYLKTDIVSVNFGKEYQVTVTVKIGDKGNRFGLRLQDVYPNRVDAVFNLKTGTLEGLKAIGNFKSDKATIKPLKNGWYQCTINVKTNVDQLKVILGPTGESNNISNWEGKTNTISNITIIPNSLKINQLIDK